MKQRLVLSRLLKVDKVHRSIYVKPRNILIKFHVHVSCHASKLFRNYRSMDSMILQQENNFSLINFLFFYLTMTSR